MDISGYIDHTLLRPDAAPSRVSELVKEALDCRFAAVCVPPYFVSQVQREINSGSPVSIATVVGFPYGYESITSKKASILASIQHGADEIDLVANLPALLSGDWEYLRNEILACMLPIRYHRKIIKVIIETGILTHQQIIDSCNFYAGFKVDFIKTSTGITGEGATPAVIQLIRSHLPDNIKIKASGGIRTFAFAKALIDSGANRIGTSAGVAIHTG